MSSNWSWKGTGPSKDQNFACSDNPGQNIFNKWSNPVKLDRKKKSLVSLFVCFLIAIRKV